jgi:hypothetical protein
MYISDPDWQSLDTSAIERARRQIECNEAQLDADQAHARKHDAIDKIKLARDKLAIQKRMLEERKAGLSITIPVAGILRAGAAEGMFVKKGSSTTNGP